MPDLLSDMSLQEIFNGLEAEMRPPVFGSGTTARHSRQASRYLAAS